MPLFSMAFLLGLGALGLKGLDKEGKHKVLVKSNTKDPELYVQRLVGEKYMEHNSQEIKKGYLEWLEYNFDLAPKEKRFWSSEFDKYKKKLTKKKKQKINTEYERKKQEYQNIINDPNRQPKRHNITHFRHYLHKDLKEKMNKVLNTTFIGNEINKAWVENYKEHFICSNTKLSSREIEKFYKICWNYTHKEGKIY